MRIEFVDHDLWKIFWTAPSGENVYTFALGYTPDDANHSASTQPPRSSRANSPQWICFASTKTPFRHPFQPLL
jgi:hypothetical protein